MSGVDFQAQISSIMEMLVSTAVSQICSVMSDVLQEEKQQLRRQIRLLERALLQSSGEASLLQRSSSTNTSSVYTEHSVPHGHEGSSDSIKNEPTDEENEPEVLIVKEEKLQTVCNLSSYEKSAEVEVQTERESRAETAVFSLDGESRKHRRRSEEVKVNAESVRLQTHSVDIINKEAEQSEDVGVQAECGGVETTGSPFNQSHYECLYESCSSADLKPDFLIIQQEEELNRRVEHLQRGSEEGVCLHPGLQDSLSGTSGDGAVWMCDQQDPPDQTSLHVLPGAALWSYDRIHSKEKMYRCGRCGRQFPQLCRLKRHERVHTGEKPFRCAKCGKHFAQANNLKVHQSVHTGERRFSCAQCGKNFSFLSNLIRHKAVHTGK